MCWIPIFINVTVTVDISYYRMSPPKLIVARKHDQVRSVVCCVCSKKVKEKDTKVKIIQQKMTPTQLLCVGVAGLHSIPMIRYIKLFVYLVKPFLIF